MKNLLTFLMLKDKAPDLKSLGCKAVRVQAPPRAPYRFTKKIKDKPNSEALMRVLDGLNQSGKVNLFFAGQGIEKSWAMKREMLSPAYTTRFADCQS